jgi:dihydrofolate reductase
MDLTIIVAISENNVIGKDNKIPWHISEDLKRFKRLTLNRNVIMGRKTYESIPEVFRPLKQRKNIVLSDTLHKQDGIYVARTIGEAIGFIDGENPYVIGGAEIYKLFLPLSNKLEITRVHKNFEGDAFFPYVNWMEWKSTKIDSNKSENGLSYSFLTYEKINNPKS